ncbi:hypothetical protein GGC65_003783 [Sphingopyxis sp. OAS728]|uniref:hypothetical protein n=1 Tax=Sphingopyxis sp. OAS728 TaxID=2663823 RepID=UPI00178B29A8|nr:hypothetical protein [Sphingopyxis sp. OAS728]MBE1529327.1 hypothetical protein [Sphingopyxis sp. OAS728]
MIFALFLAGLIAVMLFAPDTDIARWLHRATVEEPLDRLARLERKHILFLIVGLFAIHAYAAVLPAELAIALAWDMTAYVDAMIATWALSTFARLNSMKAWAAVRMAALLAPFRRLRMRARRSRPARPEARQPAANDDDPWPVPMAA